MATYFGYPCCWRRSLVLAASVLMGLVLFTTLQVYVVRATGDRLSEPSITVLRNQVTHDKPAALLAQTDIITSITSIIQNIVNATIYFPAETFQKAVEKATYAIFSAQIELIRQPMHEVLQVYAFTNAAVFGNVGLPAPVQAIGQRLTEAAVPLWALSLALIALGTLTRSAAGMGYGSNEIAIEGARWFFIALASGNAVYIVQT